MVKEDKIAIPYASAERQLADIGAKDPNKERHLYVIDKIKSIGP